MIYDVAIRFQELDKSSPIDLLYSDVAKIFKDEFSKILVEYKLNYQDALDEDLWDLVEQKPSKNIEVELIFYKDEEIEESFFAPSNVMGFFAITNEESDTGYNDKFQVYVKINEEFILNLCVNERLQEMDPTSSRYDADYLLGIVSTITHELFHVVEFVEHANGMTPAKADNIGLLTNEVCYGINALPEANEIFFQDEDHEEELEVRYDRLYEMMEERVEYKSLKLSNIIRDKIIPLKSFTSCLDYLDSQISQKISLTNTLK